MFLIKLIESDNLKDSHNIYGNNWPYLWLLQNQNYRFQGWREDWENNTGLNFIHILALNTKGRNHIYFTVHAQNIGGAGKKREKTFGALKCSCRKNHNSLFWSYMSLKYHHSIMIFVKG